HLLTCGRPMRSHDANRLPFGGAWSVTSRRCTDGGRLARPPFSFSAIAGALARKWGILRLAESNNPMAMNERLGPTERIIRTLLSYSDHMVHNRPGIVRADGALEVGVRWEPVTHKVEKGNKVVYRLKKVGKKSVREALGVLRDDGKIVSG